MFMMWSATIQQMTCRNNMYLPCRAYIHMTQQSLTIERDVGMIDVYEMSHVHSNLMNQSSTGMDHYVQLQRLFDRTVELEK